METTLSLVVIFSLGVRKSSDFFIVIQALAHSCLVDGTLPLQQDFSLLKAVDKNNIETHSIVGS